MSRTSAERGPASTPQDDHGSGFYIYGLVPADVEVTPDAHGVGGETFPVTLIRHREIAALVSEIDLNRPLGTPDNLVAHERLLNESAAEVPVLPMRFGAVMTDADAIIDELLTPYHDEFLEALGELEGRTEFVVRGRYPEKQVLQEVLDEEPEARRLRDEIRALPEEVTRDARIRLGELVNQAITARREADTEALVDELAPYSVAAAVREPTHERDAANVAVLVENERRADLERAVDEFAKRNAGRIEVRLLGPLAPYDFVMAPQEGEGAWD
ncbi:Gas vesicle synthesis protein GvpL/GvpF [Sinosporangium album]|uniref:Gas vesicle synthesis protein GvpL/GvpF n=1 Tax=Sinosporangium album TaxID=504805 RepID=A0A1G8C6C4_9ACTN|nr:GvpL/GvpF family gas vesicle protein [Sinosporangium album]SDH40898.1 Gas vesicle synthesis protein GvpL/GvpF [Sinosporangium album]